jgi:uncharacterized protein (DUF111 family)
MPVNINNKVLDVHVKIVKDSSGRITNVKPEFEDIRAIARQCKMPVKNAMDQVKTEVIKNLGVS